MNIQNIIVQVTLFLEEQFAKYVKELSHEDSVSKVTNVETVR